MAATRLTAGVLVAAFAATVAVTLVAVAAVVTGGAPVVAVVKVVGAALWMTVGAVVSGARCPALGSVGEGNSAHSGSLPRRNCSSAHVTLCGQGQQKLIVFSQVAQQPC